MNPLFLFRPCRFFSLILKDVSKRFSNHNKQLNKRERNQKMKGKLGLPKKKKKKSVCRKSLFILVKRQQQSEAGLLTFLQPNSRTTTAATKASLSSLASFVCLFLFPGFCLFFESKFFHCGFPPPLCVSLRSNFPNSGNFRFFSSSSSILTLYNSLSLLSRAFFNGAFF